jgi:hypothetical protein
MKTIPISLGNWIAIYHLDMLAQILCQQSKTATGMVEFFYYQKNLRL